MSIKISAPGSIVLIGEHAVLFGETGIGVALDKRVTVIISARDDTVINIYSSLGNYQGSLPKLTDDFNHKYSIAVLQHLQNKLSHGFDIHITSTFSATMGLGSSGALTVALLTALYKFIYNKIDKPRILQKALKIVKKVQGNGSGLDLATSLHGGLVIYNIKNTHVKQIHKNLPLHLYYSGYKISTDQILKLVATQSSQAPILYKKLYKLMGECVDYSIQAIENENLKNLGRAMNFYHGLLDALNVCDKNISSMVYTLKEQQNVLGVKISGSGLGDCIVALGHPVKNTLSSQYIPIVMSDTGVRVEK